MRVLSAVFGPAGVASPYSCFANPCKSRVLSNFLAMLALLVFNVTTVIY